MLLSATEEEKVIRILPLQLQRSGRLGMSDCMPVKLNTKYVCLEGVMGIGSN